MMRVALCIAQEHDPWLVVMAVAICLAGSAVTAQLVAHIRGARGISALGWIVLSAVGTGTMVWCTHFAAMMAFRAKAPVLLDPALTMASLLIAIVLAAPGLGLAARARFPLAGVVGGALVGLAIAAMHYAGMVAYRIDGFVIWDQRYVAASVALSVVLAAAAFHLLRLGSARHRALGALTLALAVATLHFVGMAAMTVVAAPLSEQGLSDQEFSALAIATALAGMLVVGCAAVTALIDGQTRSDSFRRLRRMALYDTLTDLPNRLHFGEELQARLATLAGARKLAVVMIDMARFKAINDTYGHHAGDQLLAALAARFAIAVKPGGDEIIARLGGDEFAALVSHEDPWVLEDFLSRITAATQPPFVFEEFSVSIGASIGVAVAPGDGLDADTLLANADLAMYRAKSLRSIEPCFYEAVMDQAVRDRRDLANDLRAAIGTPAFELHYQVQAATDTGEITGYEALCRWTHPTRGAVPPSLFIPLSEETGHIIPLSNWVLRQACFEAALWPNRHPVSVNLSPIQLSDPALIDTVRAALADSGLDPARLVLELTESAIIQDRDYALSRLRELKAMGLTLALDDFGVGYSSLDVLRSFPFDRIKLDASFVAVVDKSEQAVAILRSVTALGSALGIPVLAEGVEQVSQLRIVQAEGCTAIQGFLIGRPDRGLVDPRTVRRAMLPGPRWEAEMVA